MVASSVVIVDVYQGMQHVGITGGFLEARETTVTLRGHGERLRPAVRSRTAPPTARQERPRFTQRVSGPSREPGAYPAARPLGNRADNSTWRTEPDRAPPTPCSNSG